MLVQLLEAALRSFALGGAVWLSLRFLRVHNPQTRMTAWTVVLTASLSMPVLMDRATVAIPTYSSPRDVVIAPLSPPTTARATVQPREFPAEKINLPSAAEGAGVAEGAGLAAHSHKSSLAESPLAALDWPAPPIGPYPPGGRGLLS